jgi:hypothetical protein
MQNQGHTDLDTQIEQWKEDIGSFNEQLKQELNTHWSHYEEQIHDITLQLQVMTAERSGYKSQIDWEQRTLAAKEAQVIQMKKELEGLKSILDEREQTIYTTRAHFERQFTFMREQMSHMSNGINLETSNDNMANITRLLPPRTEILPFLTLEEVNHRILDIYVSKLRHDSAYPDSLRHPLHRFVLKYYIAVTFCYQPVVQIIWQFVASCDYLQPASANIVVFVRQDEGAQLEVLEYLPFLTKRDPIISN